VDAPDRSGFETCSEDFFYGATHYRALGGSGSRRSADALKTQSSPLRMDLGFHEGLHKLLHALGRSLATAMVLREQIDLDLFAGNLGGNQHIGQTFVVLPRVRPLSAVESRGHLEKTPLVSLGNKGDRYSFDFVCFM
jgi:hypothetical protein